ncbi:unnamed protein product [Anisakis simplex]|uniref:Uncharacterized protein n=1 Tax=Anisakis simplex TaxID=6269 RepID=A0A0M3J5W5_ANISI|nr:unnamed protein product [Anisakis simplex]
MSSDNSFNNGSAQGNDIHLVENAEEVTEDQNGVAASEKNSSSTSNRGSPLKSALKHDEPGSPSHHPDPEHHVKLDLDGSDLTEEDIFRMKILSASRRGGLLL